jgi:hypothetical protein
MVMACVFSVGPGEMPVEIQMMIFEFALGCASFAELLTIGSICHCLRVLAVEEFIDGDHKEWDGRRMVAFCDRQLGFKRIRDLIPGT